MGRREDTVSIVAVVVLIMAADLVVPAQTRVNVEIKFRRFTNPGGRSENGLYCEGVSISCETYFELCVKLSRSITTSLSGCDYQPSSLRYVKSNDIDFQTQNTNIDRTILVGRDQWDGYVSFYMVVWDDDTVRDDRIDTFTYKHLYTPGINGSGVEEFRTIYGARTSYRTSLYFSVKVFCDVHYYGSKCEKFCIGRDDSSGHYACNRSGDRICYRNWYNLPNCLKYCAPHDDNINGHYVCASNGSRICRQNWYNLPYCKVYCEPRNDSVNGHFDCSRTGEKLCYPGWYGDNCTIFCSPRNNEQYNCSETGARICYKHWYGAFCTRYCKPNRDTINGFYNCSSIGGKLCSANYFGENCTVFCKEDQNGTKRFVCDKKTGTKLCLENWTGRFCNISNIVSSSTQIAQRLTSVSLPISSFVDLATVRSVKTTLPLATVISSVQIEHTLITVNNWAQASSGFLTKTPSLVSASPGPLRSTIIMTSLKQSASYTLVYSKIHHTFSTRSFQTSIAPTESVSTLPTPLRSTTMMTSLKETVSHTSVYSKMHHISSTRNFQTSIAVTQASKKDITTATTVVIATITSKFIPSKSSSTYYKSSPAVTQRKTTAKPNTIADKEKSRNGAKNVKWLVETKEGRTVLVGAIFAFLLLVGVIFLIFMFRRLPKKDNNKDFKNLIENPDEWKTDEELAKSYSNPLYESPDKSNGSESKKKKSKLEKFYTKKDPTGEQTDNRGVILVSDMGCNGSDDSTGIYPNPLFGIRNQCYDMREETEI